MKKLLSLILATALVLSLIPAAFAADDPISVTYNFTAAEQNGVPIRDGVTASVNTNVEYLGITTVDGNIAAGEYGRLCVDYPSETYSGGHWALLGSNFPQAVTDATSGNNSAFMQIRSDYLYMPAFGADQYAAFKIKVPKTAKYKMTGFTRSATDSKALNNLDLYIAPYDGELKNQFETPGVFGNTYGTKLYKGVRYYGTRTGGLSFSQLKLPLDALKARVDVQASNAKATFDEDVQQVEKELVAGEEYVLILNAPANSRVWLQTLTLTEVPEEGNKPVEITDEISFAVGADMIVNGTSYAKNSVLKFNPGDSVTLEVTDTENFAGWVRGTTDKVGEWLSNNSRYTFNIVSPMYITPFYSTPAEGATHAVEFWDENGAFVETITATDGKAVLPEEGKYGVVGGTFKGWWLNATTQLLAGADVREGITRAVAQYDYLTAFGTKIPNSNEAAKYWMRDEVIVAYGDSYNFYQWKDVPTITFGTNEIENNPIVVLDEEKVDGAYMIEYDKGNASEIIEVGILFGSDADIVIGSTDGSKAVSRRNGDENGHGQLCAKPSSNGNSGYARGYMVYRGTDNKVYVIYTAAVAE